MFDFHFLFLMWRTYSMIINIACLVLAFYFGGVLKGATAAGAPIIAIPII